MLCFCFIFLRRVYPCCQFLWIVHVWLPLRYSLTFICLMFRMLSISLDCPCLITPSVFSNVYWQRVFRKRLVCTQLDISVFTEDSDLHTRLQNVCPTLLTIQYLNFILLELYVSCLCLVCFSLCTNLTLYKLVSILFSYMNHEPE